MEVCLIAAQMECRNGEVDANILRATGLLRQRRDLMLDGRTIICLPELFTTGYSLSRESFMRISETPPGRRAISSPFLHRNWAHTSMAAWLKDVKRHRQSMIQASSSLPAANYSRSIERYISPESMRRRYSAPEGARSSYPQKSETSD